MQAAGPDPWPGGCGCGSGDTMNAFAASDLEAADPPARPGDDAAPCSGGPPRPQLARRDPDMIAAAHEPVDARGPPVAPAETSGARPGTTSARPRPSAGGSAPGPPSPRLSAGPGIGRRGAAGAGGWRPCS